MKRFYTALLASLVLIAFSAPAWAHGTSNHKQPWLAKNDTHYGHSQFKKDKHKLKVLKQFRHLKKTYNRSIEDARQMFLEYLGSSLPDRTADIEKIRKEYEEQIAQLKETIASQEQQITDLNTTIASQKDQIDTLIANHQAELDKLTSDLTKQCDGRVADAYNDGLADGTASCQKTQPPSQPTLLNSWNTGNFYPYALDVDGSGNTYVVDQNSGTVSGYDSTGSQITSWTPGTLVEPVDLAMDSQGNVYILDQFAQESLQKFDRNGQKLNFAGSSTPLYYALGLFIDSQDNVYVTDMGGTNGGRILKFDSTGALVGTFGDVSDPNIAGDLYGDIAVDEVNQIIYVVTTYNNRVAKFQMDGTYLGSWQGSLQNPNSIAVGAQGQVFVADTFNNQIDEYDTDGNLLFNIDSNLLYRPYHIVVDNAGKLYIAVEQYQMVLIYQ